jgi:hypothetical protein
MKGVAGNMSPADVKILPADDETVPSFPDFVSVYHDVVPAGPIL